MKYTTKVKGPEERIKVNINEEFDIKYWTQLFGCTEAELRSAVKAIGNSIDEVRIYLRAK